MVDDRQNRWVQQLAYGWALAIAFLVPLVVLPVGERIGASDLLLPLGLVVLVFSRHRGRIDAAHWLLVAFLAIAFVSLFQIHDDRIQLKSGFKWIRLVGICLPFFVAARMRVDHAMLKRVLWAFFWGGVAAMLISLAVWWLQIPIRDAQQKMWYRGGTAELRAGGLVGETTHFGHLTATWIAVVGCGLVLWPPAQRPRLVTATLLGLGALAIFAASSRSAVVNLIGTAGGLAALHHYHSRRLSNRIVGLLAVAILIVLSFAALQIASQSRVLPPGSRLTKQIERFLPSETSSVDRFSSGRIDSWRRYLRRAGNHVVLGCGYKNSPSLIPGRVPDNSVLSTFLETGVLGLAAMTAFAIVLILKLAWQGWAGNSFALLLAGVWCGQVVQSLLGDIYTLWLSMPVLYLVTGLALQLPADEETI